MKLIELTPADETCNIVGHVYVNIENVSCFYRNKTKDQTAIFFVGDPEHVLVKETPKQIKNMC
jgi:hypothetical protein